MKMTFKQAYLYNSFEEFVQDRYAISHDVTVVDLKSWLDELGLEYKKSFLKQQLIDLLISSGITPDQFYDRFPSAFYVIKSDYVNRFNLSDSEYNKLKKHLLEVTKVKGSYSSYMSGFDAKEFFDMTSDKIKELIPPIDKTKSEKAKQARIKGLTCVRCGDVQSSYKYINKDKVCKWCEEREYEAKRIKKYVDMCKSMLSDDKYVILDTETTGLYDDHEVIELAVINTKGEKLYYSKFCPSIEVDEDAQRVNGFSKEILKDEPVFKSEIKTIREVLSDKVVLAYNSHFDATMLRNTANKFDESLEINHECVMRLFQNFTDRSYRTSLQNACYEMDVDIYQCHDALGDCYMVLELLRAMSNTKY